jgi:hypothetical protein
VLNQPQTPEEEDAIGTSIARGRPFGQAIWQKRTARRLGLELALCPADAPGKRE